MDCALFGSEYEPPDPGPLHPESPEREAMQRKLCGELVRKSQIWGVGGGGGGVSF